MASILGSYEDDGYSDDEDDWEEPPTDTSEVASWCKYHQEANAQVSELVSVAEFQSQCSKILTTSSSGPTESSKTSELGVTESQLAQLRDRCNPKKLLPPNGHADLRKLDINKVVAESVFTSLKHPKSLRCQFSKNTPLYGFEMADNESESEREGTDVPSEEIVLTFVVFHPVTKKRDREYAVLGSQKLTELRDKIYCQNDHLVEKDFSENPVSFKDYMSTLPRPPNRSSSAFFFINNTFYNDMRDSNSLDLSQPIIEWSSVPERLEKARRLEQFTSANMDETTFLQLSLRLGYPYLYTHHTECEHLIMFTDMRVYHRKIDRPFISSYPRMTFRHYRLVNKCQVCKSVPTWVTVNDELAICSPCHFCEDCFITLHYSKEGTKIANFEAYPYHHASH